jgi:hypothetical protein
MVGTLVTMTIAIGMGPARAQTPMTPQAEATVATTAKAPPATSATAPPKAGASEELPWLATTKPTDAAVIKTTADKAIDAPAPKPGPVATTDTSPAGKPPSAKTANLPQKCEEQAEDGCRSLKSCAWVAAIPLGDGNVSPARCAERKALAPEKDKKPKPVVAAKPKPKPDNAAAQAPTAQAKNENAPAPPAAKPEPKPEPKAETAAIQTPPKSEPVATPVAPPVQAEAAKIEAPTAEAAKAEPAKLEPTQPEPAQPEPAKPVAAQSEPAKAEVPLMIPRAPVPFLPPEQPSATVPTSQPHSDATPAATQGGDKMASDDPAGETQPLSIPGLVIAE